MKDRAGNAVKQWESFFPDLDFLPMELLGRLGETYNIVMSEHLAPLFQAHGLQVGEFDVLATLRRSGQQEDGSYALTPSQMYDSAMISSGGMTNRLDRLEKAGHIMRRPNPSDRRGTIVVLTDQGKALTEQVLEAHLANEAALVSSLSRQEQKQLANLLYKLLAGLPDNSRDNAKKTSG